MMDGQHFLHDAGDVPEQSGHGPSSKEAAALSQGYGDILTNQAFANFQRKT